MSGPHSIVDNPAPHPDSRIKYGFGRAAAVPAGGTLQLFAVGQSLQGFRALRNGTLTGLSLKTNVGDAVRSYNLEIRLNGVAAATLAFPAGGGDSQATTALAVAVVAGDIVTAFMLLTAGAGASTFTTEEALVEISE
jgi:hypothetical protein